MVAMGHRFVSAVWAMHVTGLMTGAPVVGRAAIGIAIRDFNDMLIDVIPVGMMEVTVVQVVHMVTVFDGNMAAIGAMAMRMIGMLWV
jgi:hypothetical protein